nr:hypothetical protein [Tanacetum cinerariifolium]
MEVDLFSEYLEDNSKRILVELSGRMIVIQWELKVEPNGCQLVERDIAGSSGTVTEWYRPLLIKGNGGLLDYRKRENLKEGAGNSKNRVLIIREELSEYINSPSWNYPTFYDDDEEYSVQYKEYLEKSPDAIAPILPTEEPEYSLSMGYEHLSTTPEMEFDEVTESSAKNLVPIPSEYEVSSDDGSECDVPDKDDSSPDVPIEEFKVYSNALFDYNDDLTSNDDESLLDEDVPIEEFKVYSNALFDDGEINSKKLDPHCFNAEYDLIESLLNRDTLTDSSPKFDFLLKEFSGELAHINPNLPGIKEADFDLEEEIQIADMIVESLSPSPIPVKDSDSLMDEIDLFLATDELLPPNIKNDGYDSEGDIHFVEELLVDDSIPIPEN